MEENTPQQPTSNQNQSTPPSSAASKVVYAIIALLVLAAIIFAVNRGDNNRTSNETDNTNKIGENVSSDEQKAIEAEIAGYQTQLNNLPADATAEQRAQLTIRIAGAQYRLGKYEEAIKTLDSVAATSQQNQRLWALYTNIYRDMDNEAKAKEAAKKALDLDRTNPASWLAYLELSSDLNKEELNKLYLEAVDLTDDDPDVISAHARYLESTGDKNGAIIQWTRASQVDPKNKAKYDAEVNRLRQ